MTGLFLLTCFLSLTYFAWTVTLSLLNTFTMSVQGMTISGQQGTDSSAAATDYYDITVQGQGITIPFSLATATAQKLWDNAINTPTTFNYVWFKADQDCYLQFISAATEFKIKVKAGVPQSLGFNGLLASAGTVAMSGSEPTLAAVAKIYVQNNSGSTMNGQISLVY